MTRDRWLAYLLLASWTLNVALVVAIVFPKVYPRGAIHTAPPPAPPPSWWGEDFRRQVDPWHQRRREVLERLAETFAADPLDTAAVRAWSDSLWVVRGKLQSALMERMCRMHARMTPEERAGFFRAAMAKMEGGPPAFGPRRPGWRR